MALWPIRYKPLPDELLSSWLVRLAHGHGLKVQTFCNIVFGNRKQVWNRDIDRLAPSWLLETLAEKTGTPIEDVRQTTLRAFEGVLFPRMRTTGLLQWVRTMGMYHRKRQGFAQQFCPACLKSDAEPYFRKTWRLALKTFCVQHACNLLDRCHVCAAPIAYHRVDMIKATELADVSVSRCYECQEQLAVGPQERPTEWDAEAFEALTKVVSAVDAIAVGRETPLSQETLRVLRHLTAMMLGRKYKMRLGAYMAERFSEEPLSIKQLSKPSIEIQDQSTRHTLLLWSCWLLCSPDLRLGAALKEGAFRHNHLLRDFPRPPIWYVDLAARQATVGRRRGTSGQFVR